MKKDIYITLSLILLVLSNINSQTISTIAGTGVSGSAGDGGPAINATLVGYENGLAFDRLGNLYYCTSGGSIRKISPSGIITTIAGTGAVGYSGDGGPALNAQISPRGGITVDTLGNIYFGDYFNHRVRKIDPSGIITTIAGTGVSGYSGDGGPAVNAQIDHPHRLTNDLAGNVYFTNVFGSRIRKVDISTGNITTIAGYGVAGDSGDGGPATNAQFGQLEGIAFDQMGNMYISDYIKYKIRKVNTSGIITTIAGNGLQGFSGDGGPSINSVLDGPIGITVDTCGNIFFSDGLRIRKINTSGIISTVAGTGTYGFSGDGGPALNAQFSSPYAISLDAQGNLYIGDANNFRVRKVTNVGSQHSTPVIIGGISGQTLVCSGSAPIFSTIPVSGATSYSWTLSNGLTGSSTTNTVKVHFASSPGTIQVVALNSCGPSAPVSLIVNSSSCVNLDKYDEELLFSHFPNPCNEILTIESSSQLQMEIVNQLGQKILRNLISVGTNRIDISHFQSGIYFLQISSNTVQRTKKLIVAD